MYGKLQSHTNLVESRKAAVKFINSTRKIRVFSGMKFVAKKRAISMIMSGLFDSCVYGIAPHDEENVIKLTREENPFMVIMGKIS